MSRTDPPYQNLGAFLMQHIFLRYEELDSYFRAVFELAEQKEKTYEEKVKDWEIQNPQHEYSGHEMYYDDLELSSILTKNATRSAILIIHGNLEHELFEIGSQLNDFLKETNQKSINFSKSRYGGIEHYINILQRQEFGINFSSIRPQKDLVIAYETIRNVLAHHGGYISKKSDRNKILLVEEVNIVDDELVFPTPNIVFSFLRLAEEFLGKIISCWMISQQGRKNG